jgi:hypothetical protein
MPLFVKVRSFLRNLLSFHRVEVDLDEEVRSHLELLMAENIRAGMPPTEAQRAARIELGGIEQVKEQVREERLGNWLYSVVSDCRYGLRQLRKNPGFATVAVLTLTLGIGLNSGIFTLFDATILQPLPVKDPNTIVDIYQSIESDPGPYRSFSYPEYVALRNSNSVFSGFIARNRGRIPSVNTAARRRIYSSRGCWPAGHVDREFLSFRFGHRRTTGGPSLTG